MCTKSIDVVALRVAEICKKKGWGLGWSGGGCYLLLESAEFIESLRGKGDDPPVEEAADVLFMLLGMLATHGIPPSEALEALDRKCDAMQE